MDQLPEPPDGFKWVEFKEVKCAVLVPLGWYVKHQNAGDKNMRAISKENIDQEGRFETGLTFIATQNVSTKQGKVPPSRFTENIINEIKKAHPLERQQEGPQGPFQAYRYQFIDNSQGVKPLRIFNLLLANDETGTLFQIIFESPVSTWDVDWQTGEIILKHLVLDDEI